MTYHVERCFHLASRSGRRTGGRRCIVRAGTEPAPSSAATTPTEDKPHPLARRMALAIESKRLIDGGVVADAAAMARIAGVTRARMTQILNLTLLAPDLQERLLDLRRGDAVQTRQIMAICTLTCWGRQRARLGAHLDPLYHRPAATCPAS